MDNLKILNSSLCWEQRIYNRVEGFRREILDGNGDIEHVNAILNICHEYLENYNDDDIYNATIKIKESIFYLDAFVIS